MFYVGYINDRNSNIILYNIAEDPLEKNDISATYTDIVEKMLARLAKWGKGAVPPLPKHGKGDCFPWL